jgi:hypothetical protein
MSIETERDTVLASPPASENPTNPTGASPPANPIVPKRPQNPVHGPPPNPGVVVIFGQKRDRVLRFPTLEVAFDQAERQRAGTEPLEMYDGRDYGTKLVEGARPGLRVKRGQSIPDAQKARQSG